MEWNALFFLKSALLGLGLAMDAFSVSLANALHEKEMKRARMCVIAGVFAFFQALMPMTGWICVHTAVHYFQFLQKFIPWIALLLLLYIGGKMLLEGIRHKDEDREAPKTGSSALFLQGIATSIDALSVGFAISGYDIWKALICSLVISAVTFAVCIGGLAIGKCLGTKLAGKASILGGVILIGIGIEIFVRGVF